MVFTLGFGEVFEAQLGQISRSSFPVPTQLHLLQYVGKRLSKPYFSYKIF
jgi:hypothetical protein